MAKTAINIIKGWFKTGMFPTEAQFANWLDSYWHKDDQIAAENIGGLQELLDQKVTTENGKGLSANDFTDEEKTALSDATNALSNKVDKEEGKGLSSEDFTNEEKTKLSALKKSGMFMPGAQVTEDENGKIIQAINTYTTGETRETRVAYVSNDVSRIETKDTLLEVAMIAEFDNGLPTPTNTVNADYANFTFSITLP